jgi:hypothetical protein
MKSVLESAFLLALATILVASGWIFVSKSLYKKHEKQSRSALVLFSVTFALCSLLVLLLLCEVTESLEAGTRKLAWKVDMLLLLSLILCVIPYAHLLSLAKFRVRSTKLAVVLSLTILLGLSYAFWHSTLLSPALPQGSHKYGVLDAVGRVGALGLILVSILSGYGTVSVPFGYLCLFVRPVEQGEIAAMDSQMQQAMVSKKQKIAKVEQLRMDLRTKKEGSKLASGFFSKFVNAIGSAGTRKIVQDIAALEVEISALSSLEAALLADVEDLKKQRRKALLSRTLRGHAENLLGYILSLYCVFRIINSSSALVLGEDTSSDPVSRTIALCLGFFSLSVDVHTVSQYMTLAFVGFISITSLRGFMMHMQRFFSFFRGSGIGISSTGFVLMLAELLGLYAISTLLLLRRQLPEQYRATVTDAIGGELEFDSYQREFHALFLVTALVSLGLFGSQISRRRQEADDRLPVYMPKSA